MSTRGKAAKVEHNAVVRGGARLGMAAEGLVYLLIGWLAVQLAWGTTRTTADQSGAFAQLREQPLGKALLWVVVAGLGLLALYHLASALAGRRLVERVKEAGRGVLAAGLCALAVTFALGESTSNRQQSAETTSTLLGSPGGAWLVAGVGVALVAMGLYAVKKGLCKDFLKDLRGRLSEGLERLGIVGYVAKGVSLAAIGGLFLLAAKDHAAYKSTGIDGALRALLDLPEGRWVLTAVAVGLVAYGLFAFVEAAKKRV